MPAKLPPAVINAKAFDCDPITEEAAYFGGLLLTDGYVTYKHEVGIELKNSDREIVDRLSRFIGEGVVVRERVREKWGREYRSVCFQVRSQELTTSLNRYGVIPQKSATAHAPDFLKDNRHFWRGVVDGNGWVYAPNRVGLCGTKQICEQFRDYVRNRTGIDAELKKDGKGGFLYRVDYQSRATGPLVATELYDNAGVSIPRKLTAAKGMFDLAIVERSRPLFAGRSVRPATLAVQLHIAQLRIALMRSELVRLGVQDPLILDGITS